MSRKPLKNSILPLCSSLVVVGLSSLSPLAHGWQSDDDYKFHCEFINSGRRIYTLEEESAAWWSPYRKSVTLLGPGASMSIRYATNTPFSTKEIGFSLKRFDSSDIQYGKFMDKDGTFQTVPLSQIVDFDFEIIEKENGKFYSFEETLKNNNMPACRITPEDNHTYDLGNLNLSFPALAVKVYPTNTVDSNGNPLFRVYHPAEVVWAANEKTKATKPCVFE